MLLNKIQGAYRFLYFLFFLFIALFGRSFTGVYLFGFRIGELMIGSAALLSFVFLIFAKKDNRYFSIDPRSFYLHKVIILSFFLTLFLSNGSPFLIYTYKSSSYIWTLAFIFVGFFAFIDLNEKSIIYKIIPYLLPATYILSNFYYPDFLVNFFSNYSDKFDYLKASDLLLLYVLTNIYNQKYFKNIYYHTYYFLISSAIFIPLFLFKSKGAFLPAILFFIFEFLRLRKPLILNKLKTILVLLVCVPLFYGSSYVAGLPVFNNEDAWEEEETITKIVSSVQVAAAEKDTTQLFASLYIYNGRLYSEEMMADWRLQIWQDVLSDLFWNAEYGLNEDTTVRYRTPTTRRGDTLFLTGFGYNGILEAMNHSNRRGSDMKNENVHNFAVNIMAKGGLIQLLLFLSFYLAMANKWYKETGNFRLLSFFTFALMTAFFDVAMESVRFPFLFFGAIALFFSQEKIK